MKDFLLVVWRSAVRERAYVFINVSGLAMGFACSLILGLFLFSELTFDKHFEKHDRIFRVVTELIQDGNQRTISEVPRAISPLMASEYPEIEGYVRFTTANIGGGLRLRRGDVVVNWQQAYFASDSIFDVFSHKIVAGDPRTALTAPSTVAISARVAKAYFGDKNPIGENLYTETNAAWKITLVFDDLPPNTHLRYDVLFSDKIPLLQDAATTAGLREQVSKGVGAITYLLMRPGFAIAKWEEFGREFDKRVVVPATPPGMTIRLRLQPLDQIHYGEPVAGDDTTGNRAYLYGSLGIAVLLLTVACINYANLATARALRRARSTAIRKILGASRGRLVLGTLGEAVLYAIVSALLGVALAEVVIELTPVSELLGKSVDFDLSSGGPLLAIVAVVAILIGLIAGAWPAMYLSAWMPVSAFKTRAEDSSKGSGARETLVILQFMIASCVVAATLIMLSQMRFIASTPLGFERENRVLITVRGTDKHARLPALTQQLRSNSTVLGVAQASVPPGRYNKRMMRVENDAGQAVSTEVAVVGIDAEFLGVMGIPIAAGHNLDPLGAQGEQILVNETLVRQLGWKDPLGHKIHTGRVVGVVRDFHFNSLREPIRPLVITMLSDDPSGIPEAQRPFWPRVVVVRIAGHDFGDTIQHIGKVITAFDPGNPFEYNLLEESLRTFYDTDRRALSLIMLFAGMCLFISCLGLFGLMAFATERRAREIAIRKVLGATSGQIVGLLARRIVALIAVGGAIATVATWLLMNEWLAAFAYRASINPLLLAVAVALVAILAIGVVAAQSSRLASADPAEGMRGD